MTLKELKTIINTRLNDIVSIGVHDGKASNDASFPYLIFKFPSASYTVRTREDRIMEIDYWDNTNDDSDILDASDAVKQALNYGWQSETQGFLRAFIEFEGEIPDPDTDISRIQQRFEIKVG
jgi:hypothetical protein